MPKIRQNHSKNTPKIRQNTPKHAKNTPKTRKKYAKNTPKKEKTQKTFILLEFFKTRNQSWNWIQSREIYARMSIFWSASLNLWPGRLSPKLVHKAKLRNLALKSMFRSVQDRHLQLQLIKYPGQKPFLEEDWNFLKR